MARPRKDRQIDIHGRAIEETIRLIDVHPGTAITMQQVASAVGCRAPALYRHFRNKDDLLRAAHDAGFERLYREKLAAAQRSGATALQRLRAGGIAYIGFALHNPSLYRLMFAPPPSNDQGLRRNPFERDLGLKSLSILRESVIACQAEGYLPNQEPDVVAFTLWSVVHGAAWLMLENRSPAAVTETIEPGRLVEQTVDLMMALVRSTRRQVTAPDAGMAHEGPGPEK